MMQLNFIAFAVAALVPLLIGFVWYNPKVLGTAWMKAAGLNEEKMQGSNMLLLFGLTYLLSFFIAFALNFMVIHQWGVFGTLLSPDFENPASEARQLADNIMSKYGHNYRSFGHGVIHGTIGGLFLATPILTINALFERKGFAYIAINAGYWIACFAIMGGIICAWV